MTVRLSFGSNESSRCYCFSLPLSLYFPLLFPLFCGQTCILGGCIRAQCPLGEFGGITPTVSRHFSNQQQPQQHGVSSVSSSKPCERRHTAYPAARTTHHSHSKQREWCDGRRERWYKEIRWLAEILKCIYNTFVEETYKIVLYIKRLNIKLIAF